MTALYGWGIKVKIVSRYSHRHRVPRIHPSIHTSKATNFASSYPPVHHSFISTTIHSLSPDLLPLSQVLSAIYQYKPLKRIYSLSHRLLSFFLSFFSLFLFLSLALRPPVFPSSYIHGEGSVIQTSNAQMDYMVHSHLSSLLQRPWTPHHLSKSEIPTPWRDLSRKKEKETTSRRINNNNFPNDPACT